MPEVISISCYEKILECDSNGRQLGPDYSFVLDLFLNTERTMSISSLGTSSADSSCLSSVRIVPCSLQTNNTLFKVSDI